MDAEEQKYIIIGKNIREIRERCGFTQTEVAKYLGLNDHVTISYYENAERKIPFEHLTKIADLFGVELAELITEDDKERKVNRIFAFRKDELTENDFNTLAQFNRIVKNYLKMKQLEDKHAI